MDLSILQQDFFNLFSAEWIWALITIILIDITMSWDNAIIIWMATRSLPEKQRKKAILVWIFLATILRIMFAFMVTFLLWIVWIKIAWWILLLYVVWKFYKEIRMHTWNHEWWANTKKTTTFSQAIWLIVIADVSMSLDNVLAVAWASKENLVALWIWLIVSIILMALASNFIASKMERYPQIQWVGLLIILYVSMEMIMDWWADITKEFVSTQLEFSKQFMPIFIFLISIFGFVLHDKYIKPIDKTKIQNFFANNYLIIMVLNLLVLFFVSFWWDLIKNFLFSHIAILYTFTFIIFFMIIELLAIYKTKK